MSRRLTAAAKEEAAHRRAHEKELLVEESYMDPCCARERQDRRRAGHLMRKLRAGFGDTAAPGDIAVVHYTGWLYDETAPDNRGAKFDSSVDRGQHFRFPLGASG